jgi:phosphoribosyl 1,2-cyclic phosphate phosphodiesterase
MDQPLKITLLGTGTSLGIPMIACDCNVCRSSDPSDRRLRSSILLSSGSTKVVIDSGPDFRFQLLREEIRSLDAIVFTHEHRDHTAGLDDIRALNYMLGKRIPVYATDRVHAAIRSQFGYIFEEHGYEGAPQITPVRIKDEAFNIGAITLIPIHVMHADMPVLGFRCGDFAYITDASMIPDESMKKLSGLKLLVLNALRKSPHSSHFSLTEALEIVRLLKPGKTYLTHISHMMGNHRQINSELPPGVELARDGLTLDLKDFE